MLSALGCACTCSGSSCSMIKSAEFCVSDSVVTGAAFFVSDLPFLCHVEVVMSFLEVSERVRECSFVLYVSIVVSGKLERVEISDAV